MTPPPRLVAATALLTVINRIERHGAGSPQLIVAAARLAPPTETTDLDRARTAVREVLRPAARRLLADLDGAAPSPIDPAGLPLAPLPSAPVTLSGDVVDTAGRPVPDAAVMVTATDGALVATGRTDAAGRFRIPADPGRSAVLTAAAPAHGAGAIRIDPAAGHLRCTVNHPPPTPEPHDVAGAGLQLGYESRGA